MTKCHAVNASFVVITLTTVRPVFAVTAKVDSIGAAAAHGRVASILAKTVPPNRGKRMTNPDPLYCEECFEIHAECTCPCWQCGDGEDPDSWESACIDDMYMCYGGEVPCMHGDWARLPCGVCGK